jgi:protein-tyrosine kinase
MDPTIERAANFLPRAEENEAPSRNEVSRRLVTLTAPTSVAAEQYRTLYYRIDRMRQLRPLKVVALTSALPGEGKTVTAVNLALVAARANPDSRVILVDADLRRGKVAALLGLRPKPGLSELLSGEIDSPDVVRRFASNRLAVLPAGGVPEEPTPLLAGARMKGLLKRLREGFDEVYIDLPPALPFADAGVLSVQSDGVLLVVRASVTPHRRVAQALDHLGGAPVMGCVLNGAEPSAAVYLATEKR